jgi:hypothetical protein
MKKLKIIIAILNFVYLAQADPLGSNSQGNALSAKGGRYVFGEAGGGEYMLDTQTGRLWMQVIDVKHGYQTYLKPVPYNALDGTLVTVPQKVEESETIALPPSTTTSTTSTNLFGN